MMHLPPQAYTKETLIQAYNWLRSQPPHVQELAKSPDALVALYSKSQLHGENYLNRTNLQSFKAELKNLASLMGEGGESNSPSRANPTPKAASQGPVPGSQTPAANGAAGPSAKNFPAMAPNLAEALMTPMTPQGVPVPPPSAMVAAPASLSPLPTDPTFPLFSAMTQPSMGHDLRSVLDARSWTMIQEVKNHFNLSSETEAVRLLIAMGYQKMRSQF